MLEVYEVVVDSPDNLLGHLQALAGSPEVQSITVVCLQKLILKQLQDALGEEPLLKALGGRLHWDVLEMSASF
jgi:hypothetical protein